jgi:glycosyltransferase involved in cell wall biosynthesis
LKKLLVIGHTLPEPSTTAAGGRMMQLLRLFLEEGYSITFATTAKPSERSVDLSMHNIKVVTVELNNESFDTFILQLNPSVVLFDRYITEEQFGWRVIENCPDALRILDTEDLHFLRKGREEAIKKNSPVSEANLFTEIAKRELASILRCDLSLIISEFEFDLLKNTFGVSEEILHYLPFLIENWSKMNENHSKFEEKANFMTIGNLQHAPNIDAVFYLQKVIWPLIRKQLPEVELNVYGDYGSQYIQDFHNEKEGFLVKGWVEDANHVLQESRLCLAPLRFGAGLKGKLLDAMLNGTPSITTTIGAEGMHGTLSFSGKVLDDPSEFADAAVELYTQKEKWIQAQEHGYRIVKERFQKSDYSKNFIDRVEMLCTSLKKHREANFIGQILQHHTLQSSRYMSKWIEAKNRY